MLAVNKVDTPKLEPYAEEFRGLGIKELFPISAENGNGIAELLEHVISLMPAVTPDPGLENRETRGTRDSASRNSRPLRCDARRRRRRLRPGMTAEEGSEAPIQRRRLRRRRVEPRPMSREQKEVKVAIIGRPNVGKSTLLNALTGTGRAIVSPVAGTTRDAVDEVLERDGLSYRFIDTAGIRRKGKTELMAEKLSVVMARKHLEAADVALMLIDAVEGVTAGDATIAGYAHESGRSVIIVINKWDLVTTARTDGKPPADPKVYEEQVRRHLKFLIYAPVVFVSAVDRARIWTNFFPRWSWWRASAASASAPAR